MVEKEKAVKLGSVDFATGTTAGAFGGAVASFLASQLGDLGPSAQVASVIVFGVLGIAGMAFAYLGRRKE